MVIVGGSWQEPLNTPGRLGGFSVDSNAADEPKFPQEATTSPLRVRVAGKSAPDPRVRPASLRTLGIFHARTESHRSSHHNRFLLEMVLRI